MAEMCERYVVDQSVQNLVYILMFWKVVLGVLPKGHEGYRKNSSARHRDEVRQVNCKLNQWVDPSLRDSLIRGFLNDSTAGESAQVHIRPATEASNIKRAIRLLREDGQVGKAAKALGSLGVAPMNEETVEALRRLHPQSPPPNIEKKEEGTSFKIDFQLLQQVMRSFPKGTACGASGLRAQHIIDLLGTKNKKFAVTFVALLQNLADGKAPASLAPLLASAPLLALLKKDGSIRPVAIGEILRRIVSKCALRSVMGEAVEYLGPMQTGIGTQNATESILIGLNDIFMEVANGSMNSDLWSAEDLSSLSGGLLDFINAFNMVDRNTILRETRNRFPSIFNWVQYSYGQASRLFAGKETIWSSSGVQQCDPLGPLLFTLVLQVLLDELKKIIGDKMIIAAYLDDVTLVGPIQWIKQAVQFIYERGHSLGLILSPKKSVVWTPFTSDSVDTDLCQVSTEKGVELLGGGIAVDPTYLLEVARKRVSKFQEMVELSLKVGDPQLCLLLLRQCVGMPKLNYSWRVLPPDILYGLAICCDGIISSALSWIITGEWRLLDDSTFNLASLPIALSGLGVDRPSHVLSFAHLAARRDTYGLRRRLFSPLITSDSKSVSLEKVFFSYLHSSIQESQLARKVRGVLCLGNLSCQKDYARLHDASKRLVLVDLEGKHRFSAAQQYILSATARATHDRRNQTLSLASQFLFALPNSGFGQTMDPRAFRAILQFRMLLPQRGIVAQACPRPNCRQRLDVFGYHLLGCCGKGNGNYLRHNRFVHELCALAVNVGVVARINDEEGHTAGYRGGGQRAYTDLRPGDLVFMDPLQPVLCIDVTIGSPLSAAWSNKPEGRSPGLLMAKATAKKHRLYDAAVAIHGKAFKVFAVDVAGFSNTEAIHLLRYLTEAYCRSHHIAYSHAYSIITRRVSFVLMKHLAHQLLGWK